MKFTPSSDRSLPARHPHHTFARPRPMALSLSVALMLGCLPLAASAQGDMPAQTQAPAQTQTPGSAQGQAQTQSQERSPAEAPAQAATPAATQGSAQTQTPESAQTQKPAPAQPPSQAQTPAPASASTPASAPTPAPAQTPASTPAADTPADTGKTGQQNAAPEQAPSPARTSTDGASQPASQSTSQPIPQPTPQPTPQPAPQAGTAPASNAPSAQPGAASVSNTPAAQPGAAPASNTPPAQPGAASVSNTPPTQPVNAANRLPAAPDTGDARAQARSCYVPQDLQPEPARLPGLSAALVRGKGDLLVIMLGSESTSPTSRSADPKQVPLAARLQARLMLDLAPLPPGRTIRVESIGRRSSTVAEQAALIGKKVLPRKPALVIWNMGRADARRGFPPSAMARALDKGLEQLRKQRVDTIVMDPPYHPQFEAFYRTDDYRQYVRWTMNLHEQPWLRRYDMIDYWASTGRIDLDSADPDRQETAVVFTETCIAYQLSTLVDQALSRK